MPSLLTRRTALGALFAYPAAVVAGRYAQGDADRQDWTRQVIISSDDAGMCESVNEGTIRGLTEGIVTSASIQTCCPAFEQFAEFAVANSQFDYGVHLTLTCDLPEQPWGPLTGSVASSLIDSEGNFHWWPPETTDIAQAERELRAQIDRALDSGIRITHLDNHMFALGRTAELFALYVRLGIDYGLPIRFTRTIPERMPGNTMISTLHKRLANRLTANGLPLLDHIESANYGIEPLEKRGYYLDQVYRLPAGTTEIIAHCAVTGHDINPPDVEKRQADLDFFTSPEPAERLERYRIETTAWDKFGTDYHQTARSGTRHELRLIARQTPRSWTRQEFRHLDQCPAGEPTSFRRMS